MRVFVTGATGFVGSSMVAALQAAGHSTVVLTRRKGVHLDGAHVVLGNVETRGPWQEEVASCDAVIHLAGESIGTQRWSTKRKRRIVDSRIDGTHHVVEALANAASPPAGGGRRLLLAASGIDYYGFDDSNTEIDEEAAAGDGFLARLCVDWETTARAAESSGVRVVMFRTGVVLGPGSTLMRMALPTRMYIGGPIGSGRQWFSWVHRADVVGAYLFALENDTLAGAVNLVAPGAVRQRELAQVMGQVLKRPSWTPLPGPVLRLVAGEIATYVLHGRRAVPRALSRAGFVFKYPTIEPALRDVLREPKIIDRRKPEAQGRAPTAR